MFGISSHRSISRQVSLGLVITILLASTVSFFIAHTVARTKAREHLDAKADEYIKYLKEILTLPIWNYDYETIDVIGTSFMHNEFIAGITIVDSKGKTCVRQTKKDLVPIVRRHAALTLFNLPVGSVTITLASGYYNIWNRQFFWYFSFIIVVNLISLIVMTFFLLRWSLNTPLKLLNRVVASYDARQPRKAPEHMPYTEFLPLIQTLNGMGDEIQARMDELEQAEKKYRGIVENALEGIFRATPEGRIIDANPAFAAILGYEDPSRLICDVRDMGQQHYRFPEQRKAYVDRLVKEGLVKAFEVEFLKRDGSVIWVSLNSKPVYDDAGRFIHIEGLVQDITTRKKAQDQLTRLSTAVEQVAETIIIADDSGRIKYVNPAFERRTRRPLAKVYNRPHHILAAEEAEKLLMDEVLATARDGKVWTGRMTSVKEDGEPLIEDVIASPIKSPKGKFLGYVSVNRDVTLKASYEAQVRQAQKMEAIGILAGGIAHDFNNILGVILGCSELIRNSLPKGAKAARDVEQVLTAGLRAKSLVSQILTFSRQEETRRIPVTLSPFIKEVVAFLRATVPNFIRIGFEKRTSGGVVLADPIQIQQIVMNICTNAYQAIGQHRGEIRIVLETRSLGTEGSALPPDLPPGDYVVIEISDDGPGISDKVKEKIFDPFFTTKAVGEGTGLGLSVVHGIVKTHEGAVTVESHEGEGTCFTVFLPRLEHRDLKIAFPQMTELPTGEEAILLVDDEKDLLEVLGRIISNLGYAVEAYSDAEQAVAAFDHSRFDLVIIDQVMPDMTGSLLAGMLRSRAPKVPVILMTGINEVPLETTDGDRPRFDRVIKKPLLHSDLAFAIRKVLDETP